MEAEYPGHVKNRSTTGSRATFLMKTLFAVLVAACGSNRPPLPSAPLPASSVDVNAPPPLSAPSPGPTATQEPSPDARASHVAPDTSPPAPVDTDVGRTGDAPLPEGCAQALEVIGRAHL